MSISSTAGEDLAATLQCCSPGNVGKVTPHLSPSLLLLFDLFLPCFLSGFPFVPFLLQDSAALLAAVGENPYDDKVKEI